MNVPAALSLLICLIPLAAAFACIRIISPQLKIRHEISSVVLGLVAVVPIGLIQAFLSYGASTLSEILLRDILVNGLVEESLKMLLLILLPAKKMTRLSFFLCAVLSGISLGCFEAIVYLVSGILCIELRFLTAVVIHACCAGLSGIFLYSAKTSRTRIFPFVLAVVLHGIYNYFAGFKMNSPFFYFSFAVVLASAAECRIRYRSISAEPEEKAPAR